MAVSLKMETQPRHNQSFVSRIKNEGVTFPCQFQRSRAKVDAAVQVVLRRLSEMFDL